MNTLENTIEDILVASDEDMAVQNAMWEVVVRFRRLKAATPKWESLTQGQKDYLYLLCMLGVETTGNSYPC